MITGSVATDRVALIGLGATAPGDRADVPPARLTGAQDVDVVAHVVDDACDTGHGPAAAPRGHI